MSENIKKKAFQAAAYVVSANGLSKILRLLSNLVLTRLLVPEYFGIIALARTFSTGIQLFSDIGIQPGIIRSDRSDEPDFLDTAWTLSILRGIILWPASIIIAFPASRFYQEPVLMYVIPFLALNFIITSFRSTSLISLNKELKQKFLTFMEISIQVINIALTIIFAYFLRNVWALVIGNIISEIIRTVWSFFLKGQHRNRFRLEKSAMKELLSFGKWIFVSTAMMFLATQADRLMLGKIFPTYLFGIYYIATVFSDLPKKVISSLSQKVLFPVLSNVSHLPNKEFREMIVSQRKLALIVFSVATALFAAFGDKLVIALYDDRYMQAAWMLPFLIIGIWPRVLIDSISPLLLVINKPKYLAYANLSKFIYMLIFIPVFYKFWGVLGTIIAVTLNDIPIYIAVNIGLVKHRLSFLKQEGLITLLFFLFFLAFMLLRIALGMDFPEIIDVKT